MWEKEDVKTLITALIIAPALWAFVSLILSVPE